MIQEINEKNKEVFHIIINSKLQDNWTALILALNLKCSDTSFKIVEYFIRNGADIVLISDISLGTTNKNAKKTASYSCHQWTL